MRYWVLFYRGKAGRIADRIVAFATRSPSSHCELVRSPTRPKAGETHLCVSSSGRDGGVKCREILLKEGKWAAYEVVWARSDTWDRAMSKLDAPYELWPMILSQLFNFRRHDRCKWFCSELIAHALGLNMPHAMSPGDLLRAIDNNRRTWVAARETGRDIVEEDGPLTN